MVNQISIPGNTNYDFEDGFRCEKYFWSLIQIVQCVRPDIPLPDYLRMNVGNLRVVPATIGSVARFP